MGRAPPPSDSEAEVAAAAAGGGEGLLEMQLLLKCADLSNVFKPFGVAKEWRLTAVGRGCELQKKPEIT